MKHEDIYKQFNIQLPEIAKDVIEWFPNGRNSIRVRLINGSDFVFTYFTLNDWCYETLDSYIRKMKGGTDMKC